MWARYEGQFQHGSKHGAGIYKSATGVVYEGQFKLLGMVGARHENWGLGEVWIAIL